MPDPARGGIRQQAQDELGRLRDPRLGGLSALAFGVVVGLAATAVRVSLDQVVGADPGFFILLAAAVLAAWYAGLVGGLGATATTAILAATGLLVGDPAAGPDRDEPFRLALYAAVTTATVVLVAGRRAAIARLEDASLEVADLAEKIEERDQRLEFILASSGTGFWEWDVASGDLEWSDAIFAQHGLEPAGPPPTFDTYLDMIHPDDRGPFQDGLRAALDDDIPLSLEFRVVWPDGTIHWTHGSGRAFRDATGRPVRMVGTGQDITDRRRIAEERDRLLQEERRVAVYREAFVEVISHELRTPITTILGLTQILGRPGRTDDPAARLALLDDVRAESERLHRLVEDLLVLSRIERGHVSVDPEPLQLARLLERLVPREAAIFPSITIELRTEPRLPIVAGEQTYVEQVVRNLLNNAAKYCPPGTRVTIHAARDESGSVAIRVLDEGPGISDASAARAFELFYRDPDRSKTVAGSGIGLFVCAALVEAMGGRIWARRRPDGGSEFGFALPSLAADGDGADEVDAGEPVELTRRPDPVRPAG